MEALKQIEMLPAWLNCQSVFIFAGDLGLVADNTAEWKWCLWGTNLNATGIIILTPLHCAINIYFIVIRQSKKNLSIASLMYRTGISKDADCTVNDIAAIVPNMNDAVLQN